MMDSLRRTFYRLVKNVTSSAYRSLYTVFNLDDRLTGLVGPRGVGKTTLMLQYIKNHFKDDLNSVFYFSADHIHFTQTTIYSFIENLYLSENITTFFIDEIHKYPNWNQELKNLYDGFPTIRIVFSGSSSLDLIKGSYDLSRRARLFHLPGLSFREYIQFQTQETINPVTIEGLLQDAKTLDSVVHSIPKIKGLFSEYLTRGYYPFVDESPVSYYEKLLNIIDKTVYEDIAAFYHLKTENLFIFKKLLNYLATIPPGSISTHNISQNVGVDAKTVLNYLHYLSETGLVRLIYPNAGGNKALSRPEKIFLNNTNLHYALNDKLSPDIEIGSIRELFFVQSLNNARIDVFHSPQGDYQVNNTCFEIGGKNKSRRQLQGVENSFIVKDDILLSSKGVIPLIYFGFLY